MMLYGVLSLDPICIILFMKVFISMLFSSVCRKHLSDNCLELSVV